MPRCQDGLSLVELMIAMVLALLSLGLLFSLFSTLSASSTQTRQLAFLQQNGQLVLNILNNELQNAGFWGGQDVRSLAQATSTITPPLNDCFKSGLDAGSFPQAAVPFVSIFAAHAAGGRQLNCLTDLAAGSEYLQLKRAVGQATVAAQMRSNRFYFKPDWQQSQFVDAEYIATDDSLFFPYQHLVFYIQLQAHAGQSIPVLMRKRLIRTATGSASISTDSVMDGVERLHFEFLLDTNLDGIADISLNTAQMTEVDWLQQQRRIVAVKYYVLLRTTEPDYRYRNQRQYQLGQITYSAPGDHYRRLLLSGAIHVENTLL